MSYGGTTKDEQKRNAQAAFREEALVYQRERPLLEHEARHEDMVAKTAKLRELRLAKEAAEREAAAPKVKPRKRSAK
jgi:hypothetical protein